VSERPPLDPVDLAAQLRLSATRLARRLRQETGSGLTPSQLSALATVERHGTVTLGFLAECERVAPPTVTKVVAKLEADGLLERRTDGQDRRIARVTTTEAGDALLTESRRRKDAWLASRILELDDDERARLAAALGVLERLTTKGPS
jgi:DNA-binding MarR family transcriptional regulator